jgi:5-hydroxyisourate hydrolase
MSYVTTHILDATAGTPAAGVTVRLETEGGEPIAEALTNADGRTPELGPDALDSGTYRIAFEVGPYFADRGQPTFYPSVLITFSIDAAQAHYHVPLLLSPFAYSTYRGS